MKTLRWTILIALVANATVWGIDTTVLRERRQRAAQQFHDGILLVHALSRLDIAADGYRQDPYFYYLTGVENSIGAIFAIEGKSGESWLFLPSKPPFMKSGLKPPVTPGADAARTLGIEHVVDWSELQGFLAARASSPLPIYYADDPSGFDEMPANLLSSKSPRLPCGCRRSCRSGLRLRQRNRATR